MRASVAHHTLLIIAQLSAWRPPVSIGASSCIADEQSDQHVRDQHVHVLWHLA